MGRWPFRRDPGPGALAGDATSEIREEIELYLELRTEELIEEGMDPVAARREAERRFGDRKDIERRLRTEARRRVGDRGGGWTMGGTMRDVAFAVRGLARNPGFAVVAILTLAVAIGSNTAIFSVLDAAVLRALPFPGHERLVFVNGYHLQDGERAIRNASIPEFLDWRERARSIRPLVGYGVFDATLTETGEAAELVTLEAVSADYFELLGADFAAGRGFVSEEYETPGAFPVVVLSHALWARRFDSDPSIVGGSFDLDENTVTVVGVAAEGFRGVSLETDVWTPLAMIGLVAPPQLYESRGSRFLPVIGRLTAGATVETAEAELDAIALDLQATYPEAHEDRYAGVQLLREGYLGTTGDLLWILFGAGTLLLVVAAANVANLLLVRAHARSTELVVRRALGASGGRISSQLLTESLTLAVLGGVAGLGLSAWGLRALTGLAPAGVLPAYATPGVSARVFLFTLGVLLVVGVGAGLLPAVRSGRGDLADGLRGTRGTTGGGGAQRVFVTTQVALALLLLVGAGLLGRSFRAQLAVDPGLEMEGVHVFRVQPTAARYPDAESLRRFTDALVATLEEVPGVTAVAVSSDFPFRGRSSGSYVARPDDPSTRIRYHRHSVSPGYFESLGVELLAGRFIEPSDDERSQGIAVVTDAFVRRVFPDEPSGVGRTFWAGDPSDPTNLVEIVGVVENVRYRDLTQDMMAEPNSPDVFFSLNQVPARTLEVSYRVEGSGALRAAGDLQSVREAVRALDPDVPLVDPSTLGEAYAQETATPRFAALLMSLFSTLALSLACVGLYGVLAFAVGRRTREIAVRRALGARAADVALSVVGQGVRMAAIGAVVGGVGAFLAVRLLEGLLFEVPPTDPLTFGVALAVTMAVAVVAAAVPALRAAGRAPAEALAQD